MSVNDLEIFIELEISLEFKHGYLNSSTTSRVIGKIGRTAPIPQ